MEKTFVSDINNDLVAKEALFYYPNHFSKMNLLFKDAKL